MPLPRRRLSLLASHLADRLRAVGTVLGNRNLRHLEVSWAAFNVAEYAFVIALGVYAFEAGGPLGVGLMAVIRTAPAIAAGPLLAVLTDRLARQHMLTAGLVARALASVALFLALGDVSPVWVVYLLAAVDAAFATSFWPAHTALLPELSRNREELAAANAVASVVENAGLLLGPLATGLLLLVAETPAVFLTGAGVFLVGAILSTAITTDRRPSTSATDRRSQLLDGFRVLLTNRAAALIVGLWTLESIMLGAVDVFTVVVAIDLLGLGESGAGFLGAVSGAGGVAAAIAMTTFSRGHPFGRYLGIGLLAMGFGLVLAGLLPFVVPAVAGFVVIGAAGGQIDIAAQTLLQRTVDEDHLGRVLGLFEGLYWGSLGLGAIVAGWLISATGIEAAVIGGGALLMALALLARSPLRRTDRTVSVPVERIDLVANHPVFGVLPIPTLEHLVRSMSDTRVASETVILRQGESGALIYVIEEGEVEVEVDGTSLAILSRGDLFGEIAALEHRARTATVTALRDTRLLTLDGRIFEAAVSAHTSSLDTAHSVVAARLTGIGRVRRARGH